MWPCSRPICDCTLQSRRFSLFVLALTASATAKRKPRRTEIAVAEKVGAPGRGEGSRPPAPRRMALACSAVHRRPVTRATVKEWPLVVGARRLHLRRARLGPRRRAAAGAYILQLQFPALGYAGPRRRPVLQLKEWRTRSPSTLRSPASRAASTCSLAAESRAQLLLLLL